MKKKTGGNGGFTLIELMIVIAIIGILVSVFIPMYQKMGETSKTNIENKIEEIQRPALP